MNKSIGYASFFVVAMLFGSFGLFVRILQAYFGTFQQIFIRCLGAFLVSLLVGCFMVPRPARKLIKEPRVFLFGLIFPFSMFLWTTAATLGTVHLSVFGLYVGALFTSPILSRVLFKEVISREVIYGLVLAVVGVTLFCIRPTEGFNLYALLLSVSAGMFQSISLCYRRWLGDINRSVVVFVQSLGALLVVSGILFFTNIEMLPRIGFLPYGIGLTYGALAVLISYLLLIGSQNLDITKGNIILSTELIWAAILAYVFLGEEPGKYEMIGSGFLFSAMIMTIPKRRRRALETT